MKSRSVSTSSYAITSPSPKGRHTSAQGIALGASSQNMASSEGAKPDTGQLFLNRLLEERDASFRGSRKYRPPCKPDLSGLPQLPVGWVWASPEQLSDSAPYSLAIGPFGSNLKVSDYRESGIPLVFVRNIRAEDFSMLAKFVSEQKASELTAHTVAGGEILVTKMGDPPGDAAFYPPDAPNAVITADCIKWRLSPELHTPKFFVYAIRSRVVHQQILERTRGVAQKKISLERFRDLAFPLPPAPEQRLIVAEIEKQFTRLEAGVAALRRMQANLKRYSAAVLKAACEGRLVPPEVELQRQLKTKNSKLETGAQLLARILTERRQNWQGRGKYKEPAAPDTRNLPSLPESWTWVSWEMVLAHEDGAFKRGPFGSALTKAIFVEKGFKVYEQYCPINDDCSFARYYITPEKFEELQAFEVKAGDYLISCSGVTLGRITRVPEHFERGIINQALLRVRIDESVINHRYFLRLFRSALFQTAIFDNSTGSAIPNVKGVKDLKAMAIPLPPLAEQTRIVAEVERRMSVVEDLEAGVSANLLRAARLRESILQKAFTGELP